MIASRAAISTVGALDVTDYPRLASIH